MSLKNRNFLKLLDYTPPRSKRCWIWPLTSRPGRRPASATMPCAAKSIALIFEKTSTRTRCSFEVAAHDLGMEVTYLDPSGSQIGKKESIADTARVLGQDVRRH